MSMQAERSSWGSQLPALPPAFSSLRRARKGSLHRLIFYEAAGVLHTTIVPHYTVIKTHFVTAPHNWWGLDPRNMLFQLLKEQIGRRRQRLNRDGLEVCKVTFLHPSSLSSPLFSLQVCTSQLALSEPFAGLGFWAAEESNQPCSEHWLTAFEPSLQVFLPSSCRCCAGQSPASWLCAWGLCGKHPSPLLSVRTAVLVQHLPSQQRKKCWSVQSHFCFVYCLL